MTLPDGNLIILQEGEYSYRVNLGIYDNLYDLQNKIQAECDKIGACLKHQKKKPIEIIGYSFGYGHYPGIWPVENSPNFPYKEIIEHLDKPCPRINVYRTNDPENRENVSIESYDLELHILNFITNYEPDSEKYNELSMLL